MRRIIVAVIAYVVLLLITPEISGRFMKDAPLAVNWIIFAAACFCIGFVAFAAPVYSRLSRPKSHPITSALLLIALCLAVAGTAWLQFVVAGSSPRDLRARIRSSVYDPERSTIVTKVTFSNPGATPRTIASVKYVFRTAKHPTQVLAFPTAKTTFMDGLKHPLQVKAKSCQLKTYEQSVDTAALEGKADVGIQFVVLDSGGDKKYKTRFFGKWAAQGDHNAEAYTVSPLTMSLDDGVTRATTE
jgi:hypothetical protein